jgi:hypothetical protein
LAPNGTTHIAVVRIETGSDFHVHRNDAALLHAAVTELARVARQPGIAAFQIDFDARKSERGFYRRLLTDLRQQMPSSLPLEMTALVSWCSNDDWIGGLPVNAAIPMFFRMEPDRRRLALTTAPEYQIREPLCSGSLGVSTTEPWPSDMAGKRVFVFADRGWDQNLAAVPSAFTPAPGPEDSHR